MTTNISRRTWLASLVGMVVGGKVVAEAPKVWVEHKPERFVWKLEARTNSSWQVIQGIGSVSFEDYLKEMSSYFPPDKIEYDIKCLGVWGNSGTADKWEESFGKDMLESQRRNKWA